MKKKKPRIITKRKKELDAQRTLWRKQHRTLNGRIILYPEKPPEHINARGNKLYHYFWNAILLNAEPQDIPGIISTLRSRITTKQEPQKIRMIRTMIGMAEDAYQLKRLEDIKDYDSELYLGKKPVYNAETGVIHKNGVMYTTDYSENEDSILLRDVEGIIKDVLYSEPGTEQTNNHVRNNLYKDWQYMEKI